MGTTRITSNQNSPDTRFTLEADVVDTDGYGAGNGYGRWKIRYYLKCVNTGTSGSFYNGSGSQQGRGNGTAFRTHSGNPFLPSGVSGGATRWYEGPYDVWVNANSEGYWSGSSQTYPVQMHLDYGTIDTTPSGSLTLSRIAQKPGKVPTPTASSIGTTSAVLSWGAADGNGATIDSYKLRRNTVYPPESAGYVDNNANNRSRTSSGMLPATRYYFCVYAHNSVGWSEERSNNLNVDMKPEAPATPSVSAYDATSVTLSWTDRNGWLMDHYEVQYSTSSTFSGATTVTTSGKSLKISGLIPGTLYYFRVRAIASSGTSSYSSTRTQQTVVVSAPSITVTPSASGTSATIVPSPPAGAPQPTNYHVALFSSSGVSIPPDATVLPGQSYTRSGLTPGETYKWQAWATYGTTDTDKSAMVTVTQPKPNTTPGDYFDGATAAGADVTYSWTGTANNSESVATGVLPLGWSAAVTGYPGFLQRVTGGYVGSYCAMFTVEGDMDTVGAFDVGLDHAGIDAAAGATYYAAVYVSPSATRSLTARLDWYDASGDLISSSFGDETTVSSGPWTQLSVSDQAPSGTAEVALRIVDGATQATAWVGGDSILMDAAIITLGSQEVPYFDGATPDDGGFVYSWTGTANQSTSTRHYDPDSLPDPFLDPNCPPVPAAPRPPVVADACLEDNGEWRRYWGRIDPGEVSDFFDTVPIISITTGASAERQIRVRFYANPFGRSVDQIDPGDYCSEQIISYLPAQATITLDGVSSKAWATVIGGGQVVANYLLYGEDGAPASWPELSCGIPYYITIDTPSDGPENNLTANVQMVVRYQ